MGHGSKDPHGTPAPPRRLRRRARRDRRLPGARLRGHGADLLQQFGDGIAALLQDAEALGLSDRLAVLTYSEFGRRAEENASHGTDHGTAAPLFLCGRRVAGGLYGPAPDLEHLADGDPPWKVDFRSVYGAVLRDWLGVAPELLLGGSFPPPRLFRG